MVSHVFPLPSPNLRVTHIFFYDAVFINGSVDLVPQLINDQVKDGGRVVTIKRDGQIGYMVILKKAGNYMNQINHFEITVPYISKDFIRKSEFAF